MNEVEYLPDTFLLRNSVDVISNTYGSQLSELCKSTGVRICKGRLENSVGFTYKSEIGCSTIDYLLCKQEHFEIIISFQILYMNEFSDHTPLAFSLASDGLKCQSDQKLCNKTTVI